MTSNGGTNSYSNVNYSGNNSMNVVSSTDYTRDHSQGHHREGAKTNYSNFGHNPTHPTHNSTGSHGSAGLKQRGERLDSHNEKNRQNLSDNHESGSLHTRGLSRQSKNSANMDTKKKRILRNVRQDKAKSTPKKFSEKKFFSRFLWL